MQLDVDSLTLFQDYYPNPILNPSRRIFGLPPQTMAPHKKKHGTKMHTSGGGEKGWEPEKPLCFVLGIFSHGFSTAPVSKAALPVVMEHPNAERSCPVDSLEVPT